MNRNQNDRQDNSRGFQTHRSERYRHPENDNNYRFDDYGSSARGGYGNEGHSGTWGNQGNEMAGSRNTANQDTYGTYSTSRNYGNMGSYGGAQGFGTSRGGTIGQRHYGSADTDYNFESGMGNPGEARGSDYSPAGRRAYAYESDYSSRSSGNDRYGAGSTRGFQDNNSGNYGSNQSDYNYYGGMGSPDQARQSNLNSPSRGINYSPDRDNSSDNDQNRGFLGHNRRGSRGYDRNESSSSGSHDLYGSDTSRRFEGSNQGRYNFDQDDYNSGSGSSRGNSNYGSSNKRGSYGSDRYNSANFGGAEGSYMGSGYNRTSENEYGTSNRDGAYGDRNFNRGFVSSDNNYLASRNRGRTFDRDRGDDRDRGFGGRY
ncbi:hypothetical protein DXT99_18870 [Pontibacter diazotrophicus]|uniref:Uncharacterized protein n=1 Tax=Pontibacter diazotrophicus TaxID=1400979 RepID=A0A3D8L851_9BACT|nr:hypothetical protein [Pontibacter diazotrophicus]RDV13601.1 hypothetical protein DXT99_18870 [Pontibacter diazotrophicus]